jgi:membrane protein
LRCCWRGRAKECHAVSSYGAAGSIVALVVWVYYSSQIVFMGAEITQVYARRFGSKIEPSKDAIRVEKPR